MPEIGIRTLHTSEEFAAAVELQKVYWGEDMSDQVPSHMLLSIARYGGHVHGAFDGDKMVGLLIGFLGAHYHSDTDDATTCLLIMSKRMVVLPAYRGQKIGENLKLAQRDFARQHHVQLVSWTFDPLLSRNAYLNLHKLGAIGQEYVVDFFGSGASNPVMNADRLVANWWVNHPHLEKPAPVNLFHTPIANAVSLTEGGLLIPHEFRLPEHDVLRLEIPEEFLALERIDPVLGKQWRDYIRFAFQRLLEAGYIATDFMRVENRVFYVFTRDDGTFNFQ
jgi:predicted GNAT superfamily acetyltransferase